MNRETFDNFQPLDFLKLSKYLVNFLEENGWNNSSLERTIFGRLYYGTFLYVREWLSEKTDFNVNNNGSDHRNIPKFIMSKGPFDDEKNSYISGNFKELRKLRNQADYYLTVPDENSKEYNRWINEDLNYAIDLAEDIINSFKNY